MIKNILSIETIGPSDHALALVATVSEITDNENIILDATIVHKEMVFLAEKRNLIIHGEWLIGPHVAVLSGSSLLPEVSGIKRKLTKDGEKVDIQPSAPEIDILTVRCQKIRPFLAKMQGKLYQDPAILVNLKPIPTR